MCLVDNECDAPYLPGVRRIASDGWGGGDIIEENGRLGIRLHCGGPVRGGLCIGQKMYFDELNEKNQLQWLIGNEMV